MFKRFTHYFACLLLVLMPLQGIAAANMSICNSMMQAIEGQQLKTIPCHMHMSGMSKMNQESCEHNASCKTICATLCASVSAVTTLPSNIKPDTFLASAGLISLLHQSYVSITLPSLQRPPILLA